MKQLIQSYKTGELGIFEVPAPACIQNGVLIRTTTSLVSAGTEKMIVDIAKKSLLGKARARPDLVKQVVSKMRQEGVKTTLEKIFTKLDTPIPLGYSCAGIVTTLGANVAGITVGDRVACGGAGYANHGEINYIPKNLFVKIPDNVDDTDATFVTAGAIALQGVRQAELTLGENIAVVGLGLIGQLTVQLLKANGCKVLGTDINSEKLALAQKLGADMVCTAGELLNAAAEFSSGHGVDAVIITASTSGNQPVQDAGEISRLKGRVVVVGMVGMDIPRDIYYKKELDVKLSMSYGPGRYDPNYEEKGHDYPIGYVRWTEKRNFETFLEFVSEGKVTPKALVTHRFPFEEALEVYELISEGKEKHIGIILEYENTEGDKVKGVEEKGEERGEDLRTVTLEKDPEWSVVKSELPIVGMIGAGNFAKSIILPTLKKGKGYELLGLCTTTGVSARPTGDKYGFNYITTDSDEIFLDPKINTVMITTRHDSHAAYVIKALKAGKHVFVEKPLCINEEQLDEIISIYSSLLTNNDSQITSNSVPLLMVGFNRRFSPLIRKMKGAIGDKTISVVYRINGGIIPKQSWIQDPEIGGGRIIGEVCHFVDTCSYLAGSIPIKVFARSVKKNDQSIPDEDNVNIVITFANGSTAAIHYFAFGNRQMPKEQLEVFARDTAIKMNDFRDLEIFRGNKKKRHRSINQDKGFLNEFKAFRESIKTGAPAISFGSICNTTRTTFSILESIRKGEGVNICP